jgi:hypothetical protein
MPVQSVRKTTVQRTRQQSHSTSLANERFHLAADREGNCDDTLCFGINNTVSGFFGGGGFGPPEATGSVAVEVEEVLLMPRSRITASRLANFLASCGSTGSMYLCLLGAVSRGAGLGAIILVTVIMPDLGMGEGMADEEAGDVDGVEGVGVVVDAPSGFDLLDELAGTGVDVVDSA